MLNFTANGRVAKWSSFLVRSEMKLLHAFCSSLVKVYQKQLYPQTFKLICMAKFSSSIYLTRISRKINVIKEWLRSLRVRMNPHEEWNIGRACKCSFDKGGFECSYLSNRCAHAIILHHDEACYRIWWSMLSKGLDLRWRTWRIENLIVITHNYY